jgi:CAAX protease family protein
MPPVEAPRSHSAAIAGLAVAWVGTGLLVSPWSRVLGEPGRVATALVEQAALWLLFAAVLAIVLLWERQPLASLWLQPFRWQSVGWGLLLVAAFAIILPVREWVRRAADLPGYAAGMEQVLALPLWVRVLAVIQAGIVEETLFTGYAVTRLTLLTGRVWLAAALSLIVFCALHVPVWGAGAALAFFVSGVLSMAFFVWRRDLLAMIVAHVTIDTWGIVLTPLFSEWWKEGRFS